MGLDNSNRTVLAHRVIRGGAFRADRQYRKVSLGLVPFPQKLYKHPQNEN